MEEELLSNIKTLFNSAELVYESKDYLQKLTKKYGRNSEGMLKNLNAVKYAETVILCPVENQEKMRNYLQTWDIEFREIPLLITSRLV